MWHWAILSADVIDSVIWIDDRGVLSICVIFAWRTFDIRVDIEILINEKEKIMPCIRVQTSCAMSETAKTNIKSALGEAIAVIPGKSENWLMVVLEDNATIYFKGNDSEASAYVNVGVYGSPNERAFNALTGEICKILHDELGIAANRIYVQYSTTEHWGWNGQNF